MYPLFSKDDVRNGSDWLKRHIIVKHLSKFKLDTYSVTND